MQFSLKRLLILFAFANLLIAAAFVFPPLLSTFVLTFVSLAVLPPIVIVGVVQTRGSRQAFFLGAMVTGTPHFVINLYLMFATAISFDVEQFFATDNEFNFFGVMHLGLIVVGAMGGLVGMAAHTFLLPVSDSKSSDLDAKLTTETPVAGTWSEGEITGSESAATQQVKLPR